MKKTTVIIILVLVFLVIGVVVYLFANSNKNSQVTTKTTESTGLGNLLANSNPGIFGLMFGGGRSKA